MREYKEVLGRRSAVEFKCSESPHMTKSLAIAIEDLELERAWIVYPGSHSFAVHEKVDVAPLLGVPSRLKRSR